MMMGGYMGGEHKIQYTDDVLQNFIPETYIILLTNVIQINSIKKKISEILQIQMYQKNNKLQPQQGLFLESR